jgi:pyruvate dehydrogenase E1 component alpha subunit
MDPDVVFEAAAEAVTRARAGEGPTFLEFSTYRFYGPHTFELKDRLRYRSEDEVEQWRARDPLPLAASRVSEAARERIDAGIEALLDEAVRFALGSPRLDPADALAYHYASGLTPRAGVTDGPRIPAGVADA